MNRRCFKVLRPIKIGVNGVEGRWDGGVMDSQRHSSLLPIFSLMQEKLTRKADLIVRPVVFSQPWLSPGL